MFRHRVAMAAVFMGAAAAVSLTGLAVQGGGRAEASPSPAPMSLSSEQNPTGGCIYSLAKIAKLLCENTEEDFCKPHMGGFVTATYYHGEFCDSLKRRGEY